MIENDCVTSIPKKDLTKTEGKTKQQMKKKKEKKRLYEQNRKKGSNGNKVPSGNGRARGMTTESVLKNRQTEQNKIVFFLSILSWLLVSIIREGILVLLSPSLS
jgi:hypothetical protein